MARRRWRWVVRSPPLLRPPPSGLSPARRGCGLRAISTSARVIRVQTTAHGASDFRRSGHVLPCWARGTGLGAAYLDAPIVDQSAGRVYAFIGDDNNNATPVPVAPATHAALCTSSRNQLLRRQLRSRSHWGTLLQALSNTQVLSITLFQLSQSSTANRDSYVCGYASGVPTLYAIPITGAAGMTAGAAQRGQRSPSGTATCSPIRRSVPGPPRPTTTSS